MLNLILFLLMLFAPTLLIVTAWGLTTLYRIYFPERLIPLDEDPFFLKKRAIEQGEVVSVGVFEIYEAQQKRRQEGPTVPYFYYEQTSEGWPDEWTLDLWERRN